MDYEKHPVYRNINRQLKNLPAVRPASPSINISVSDAKAILSMIKELSELRAKQ